MMQAISARINHCDIIKKFTRIEHFSYSIGSYKEAYLQI